MAANNPTETSRRSLVRIALDAFGGDECPTPELEGAIAAARAGVHIVLVGDEAKLEPLLAHIEDREALPLEIHHAPDKISMSESPAKAVRSKPQASMPVCFDLVKTGAADAVMSAGNSGAMMACGLFKYRRIKGVDRPALVTSLPTKRGYVTFLDVGANVDVRPLNLVQFAVLGAVYAQFKHARPKPRVGILNNGSEDSKGTGLTRAAHQLLRDTSSELLTYGGFAEGEDIFGGEFDVVVTDGFTGNVALKTSEAVGRLVAGWLKQSIASSGPVGLAGAWLLKPAFAELRAMLDPDSYGAAPLLGVNGLAFIAHGKSSAAAIEKALALAARSVSEELTPQLSTAISRHAALFEAAKQLEHDPHRSGS